MQEKSNDLATELSSEKLGRMTEFFRVLGDPTRVRMLWALDAREMCVGELASLLGMTLSAVSHQLRILRAGCLVTHRKEGKNTFYRLADDHVKDIVEKAMEHVCED